MKELRQAISLIFKKDNKVFVVKRSDKKESFPNFWSIPSTYIHEGETPTIAANRLAAKKLGVSNIVLDKNPIGVSDVVEREKDKLQMTDFNVISYDGELTLNPNEYTEYRWLSSQELKELLEKEHNGVMGECTRTFLKSEGL